MQTIPEENKVKEFNHEGEDPHSEYASQTKEREYLQPDNFQSKIKGIKTKLDSIKQTIGFEMGHQNPLTMESTNSGYN